TLFYFYTPASSLIYSLSLHDALPIFSFIELMSKYMFPGDILHVSTGKTNGNDTIELTYNYEVKQGTFPKELIPFYGIGNGDYFCLHSKECPNTNVYYYSHEEQSFEKDSDSFMQWVKQLPDFLN